MCDKCEPARIVAAKVAQDLVENTCCSAEKTRNFYRKQGVEAENERILQIIKTLPFTWMGDVKQIDVGKDHLIALIERGTK